MKAVAWMKYGPPEVLRIQEMARPVPKDNQVQIRIHATTVTAGDCEIRSFRMPPIIWLPMRLYMGVLSPRQRILGQELAGVVESVGKDVTRFRKGDHVMAATDIGMGAYAEYICLPEKSDMSVIAIKPEFLTWEQAASIPVGGLEALHFMRKADIQKGQRVLINGAGGSIGTFAVQIAKYYGAEVTAVDSAEKLDLLCSLGADHVIDFTREDFTRRGETYDIIFDVVGKSPFARSVASLSRNGRYLLANLSLSALIRGLWVSRTSSKKVILGTAGRTVEDFRFFNSLIETGAVTPIIDRVFPLEQIVDAHRYVESGHKQGSVVITV